jgi:uncharacterized protein YbbK (DUF523 family)
MMHVLVSACLLGQKVRYNGAAAFADDAILARWVEEGRVIPFCPEVAGGLSVPRPPAEIRREGGEAVLDRRAVVLTRDGLDVTAHFLDGARKALETARACGARIAILKDGSPSCGSTWIYGGAFNGDRQAAPGVTSALLARHGIRVFSEQQLGEADQYLKRIEPDAP